MTHDFLICRCTAQKVHDWTDLQEANKRQKRWRGSKQLKGPKQGNKTLLFAQNSYHRCQRLLLVCWGWHIGGDDLIFLPYTRRSWNCLQRTNFCRTLLIFDCCCYILWWHTTVSFGTSPVILKRTGTALMLIICCLHGSSHRCSDMSEHIIHPDSRSFPAKCDTFSDEKVRISCQLSHRRNSR